MGVLSLPCRPLAPARFNPRACARRRRQPSTVAWMVAIERSTFVLSTWQRHSGSAFSTKLGSRRVTLEHPS